VAVLLEVVVLDLPYAVEAHPVGQLDLLQRVLEQLVVRALRPPGTRVLVLVEDAEARGADIFSSRPPQRPMLRWWSPLG
jgi:hypothetical protein